MLLHRSENRFGVVAKEPSIERRAAVGGLFLGSVVSVGTMPTKSQKRETERLMIDGRRCLLQRVRGAYRNGRRFSF